MESIIQIKEKVDMLGKKALAFLGFWFRDCTGYMEIRFIPNKYLKYLKYKELKEIKEEIRKRGGSEEEIKKAKNKKYSGIYTFSKYIPIYWWKSQNEEILPQIRQTFEIIYKSNQNGFDVYFGVCPRYQIPPLINKKTREIIYHGMTGEPLPGSGTAEYVREIPGIWVDLDKKDFEGGIIPETYKLLNPSVVNFTGNGIHCFTKFSTPLPGTGSEIPFVNQMGEFLGGDKVGDTPRIMRLPGTYNVKKLKENETPSLLCETIDFSGNTFTLQEAETIFGRMNVGEFGQPLGFKGGQRELEYFGGGQKKSNTQNTQTTTSTGTGTRQKTGGNGKRGGTGRPPDYYEKLIFNGSPAGSRNTDLTSLTGYYRTAKKMSKEIFTQTIAPVFCQRCSPPMDWDEALTVIDSVYSYPESEPDLPAEDEGERIPLYTLKPKAEDYPYYSFPDISDIFRNIEENSDRRIIVQAPTGTGKTYNIIKSVINLYNKGENITLLFFTLREVNFAESLLKAELDLKDKNGVISIHTSEQNDKEIKQIAISTYSGYLAWKGETGFNFSIVRKLINDRIVFIDEAQFLYYGKCVINQLLRAKYQFKKSEQVTESDCYRRRSVCPLIEKNTLPTLSLEKYFEEVKNTCSNCFFSYARTTVNQLYGNFLGRIQSKEDLLQEPHYPLSLETYTNKDEKAKDIRAIIESGNCFQIYNTLHISGIPQRCLSARKTYYLSEEEEKKAYINRELFFNRLIQNMRNPCIKYDFPVFFNKPNKSWTGGIFLWEEWNGESDDGDLVLFPHSPCRTPILSGEDITPIIQLLKAKKLIMVSATIPGELVNLVNYCIELEADGNEEPAPPLKVCKSEITPFSFDVTLLIMNQGISSYGTAKICREVKKKQKNIKIFAVEKNKSQAMETYRQLTTGKSGIPDFASLFFERNYEAFTWDKSTEDTKKDIIVSYVKSGMDYGVNMPDRDLVIIDCNLFIPNSAIGGLLQQSLNNFHLVGDLQEKQEAIIQQGITQIIGRLFRSKLDRIPGKTVPDHTRRIVLLLHSLPEGIQVRLDQKLINQDEFKVYTNYEFISTLDKTPWGSIAKNTVKALRGEDFDQGEDDKKKRKELETKKRSDINPNLRGDIPQRDYKQEREDKVKAMAEGGENWTAIYKKIRVDRLDYEERERLKEIFNKINKVQSN